MGRGAKTYHGSVSEKSLRPRGAKNARCHGAHYWGAWHVKELWNVPFALLGYPFLDGLGERTFV